jgi:hypothetical protein
VLTVALVVIGMAFLLDVRKNGRVHFWFAPNHVLPHTCASRILFNADCAGCGLTRSFIHLAAFRPMESWRVHRAGWLIALLVIGQVPYRFLQLRRIAKGQPTPAPVLAFWILAGVASAVLLHWGLSLFGV